MPRDTTRRGQGSDWVRFLLLPLAGLALLAGLLAGLTRLGWDLPMPNDDLMLVHGPLMVSGFFGTLIGLERAVALRTPWVFGAPILTGLGGLGLVFGAPLPDCAAMIVLGSLIYVGANLTVVAHQPAPFTVTIALGGACWLAGSVLWWLDRPVPELVLWWALFLVLTIAGERLELSRLLQPPRAAVTLFAAALAIALLGAALGLVEPAPGWRVAGIGFVLLAAWLARYDIARRTVRIPGLPRYTAVCLLTGYVWLALAGLGAAAATVSSDSFAYDAVLHAIFLGYVFAMVFGHAPIVLPAITHLALPYRPAFYAPLALLDAGLALRVIGDLAAWPFGRLYGGLVNAIAILAFLALVIGAIRAGRRVAAGGARPKAAS